MEIILENGIASKLLGTYYIVYIKNTKTIQITKKNTKILERNTKKNNETKGNNNKTRIFIHFWVVGGDRRWSAVKRPTGRDKSKVDNPEKLTTQDEEKKYLCWTSP
jgi:hypothetical protein